MVKISVYLNRRVYVMWLIHCMHFQGFHLPKRTQTPRNYLVTERIHLKLSRKYEGVLINNQPIPFPMDLDGHDLHALFQYMFYTWVQNCTRIESFFNKILNVKHG